MPKIRQGFEHMAVVIRFVGLIDFVWKHVVVSKFDNEKRMTFAAPLDSISHILAILKELHGARQYHSREWRLLIVILMKSWVSNNFFHSPKAMFKMRGGEGSTAREALKHKSIEKVIMCDIDQLTHMQLTEGYVVGTDLYLGLVSVDRNEGRKTRNWGPVDRLQAHA
ncbi:hypothetical protein LXL04_011461 [Taraxacum kok-saghyz]